MFRWAERSPRLTPIGIPGEALENPIFLRANNRQKTLFAADCTRDWESGGRVVSMAIERQTGALTCINSVTSAGVIPVFLELTADDSHLFVANCGPFGRGTEGRTVAAFRVRASGRMDEAKTIQPHRENSIDPERQTSPHPHAIAMHPQGRWIYVPDLGSDRIYCYRYDPRLGGLMREPDNTTDLPRGSGPRYLKFHPDQPFAYLNTEMSNTLHVFHVQAEGRLEHAQAISTLNSGDKDGNCADLQIHPCGRFLFTTNRSLQTIVTFEINRSTGHLTKLCQTSTGGAFPRSLAISPNGKTLLVGNEQGHSVCGFAFNSEHGKLKALGTLAEMPGPACIAFATV